MFFISWTQLTFFQACFTGKMDKKFNKKLYYEFEGHFFLGNYEINKTRPFKASRKTTTLDTKLDPTSEKIEVPAELYAMHGGKWQKHPTVFLTHDQHANAYLNVILSSNGHILVSFTPTVPSMTDFYEEAERLRLTRGVL